MEKKGEKKLQNSEILLKYLHGSCEKNIEKGFKSSKGAKDSKGSKNPKSLKG